ncbi:helix-turn-helix domain-containing protein [Natrarchaeobius chitinivorans]|uniref:helix-turn-helix domain-containing protein n=1 Tax=Natrarchaeobius chitinivorans TaxID=1679083 RepID=UPI00311DB185
MIPDPQKETLVRASDRGYFESPRQVTMEELGDELGMSPQAVVSRLRLGPKHILENTPPETDGSNQ